MFVVFWRETKGPTIDPGADQFTIVESKEEAAAAFAQLLQLDSTHCAAWSPITGDATEPQWLDPQGAAPSVFDALAGEFSQWLRDHGLDGESDDAHGYLMRPDLTPLERAWLSDFVRRWDAMDSERDSILKVMRENEQSESRRDALKLRLVQLG